MKTSLSLLLVAVLFVSCSSDDDNSIELTSADATLFSGEEFQIEAKSDLKITYSSENTYHASVSEEGIIKAGKVGETNIVLTNEKDTRKVKVTIKAKSNLYPEPNTEFGISRSDLIKKMGTPSKETSTGIAYYDYSTNAPQASFLFDENDKLESSAVLVNSSQTSNLGTFLSERYVPYTSNDYTIFFIDALKWENKSMVIGADLYNTSYWMVAYMSADLINKNSQRSVNDEFLEEMKKLFKE